MDATKTKHRLLPHLVALTVMAPTYLVVSSLTNQRSLGVTVAIVLALASFLAIRLVQLRGKLTLAITVFGIPLLVAIFFAAHHALNPFIRRQQIITTLRNSGMTIDVRPPDRDGEWKRDEQGRMLPSWLADWIGPDCLSRIAMVAGNIEDLQAIPLRQLGGSEIERLDLIRVASTRPVSSELIEWLNEINEAELRLDLYEFSKTDAVAFSKLTRPFDANLHLKPVSADLSQLKEMASARVTLPLSPQQASQLASLPNLRFLSLESSTVSAAAIKALGGRRRPGFFNISRATLDGEAWQALADSGLDQINLYDVDAVNVKAAPPRLTDHPVRWIYLWNENLMMDEAHRLVEYFQCEEFRINGSGFVGDVDELWVHPRLKLVSVADNTFEWTDHRRPAEPAED